MKLASALAASTLLLTACGPASTQSGLSLFNGESTEGWSIRAVHGGQGGLWSVESGVLVAKQDTDHSGGLIGTTDLFSDYEIELEFSVDDPVDTGLFLRTREDGMGYQITIDYHSEGFVGSL